MRNLLIISSLLLLGLNGFGQKTKSICTSTIDTLTNNEVFIIADKMPEVEGGKMVLLKELANIKYPNQGCYSGKVWVSFIVTSKGNIIGKRISRDPSGGKIGNQVLKLIDNIKWTPGSCQGKNISILYSLPVIIDLK